MKQILLLSLIIAMVYGCSSSKGKDGEEREFKKSYVVRNAKYARLPGWITEPQGWAKREDKKDSKKFRYYVSETEIIKNRRLCVKSAEAQATAAIAGELTQFIKNSFSQAMHGDPDSDVESYMDETLAQEIQSFIVGARVHRSYWEKRTYKEELGAEEDKTGYFCAALVKMKASVVKKAIKKALKRLEGVADTEAKEKVKDALDKVEKKFDNI